MILTEIILLIILLILTVYFTAAEIAITSFGTNKIEELRESKDKSASAFDLIQKDPNAFFGTIQVITTIFVLSFAIIFAHLVIQVLVPVLRDSEIFVLKHYPSAISFIVAIILSSFIILIFVSLLPKVIGYRFSEKIGKTSVTTFIILTIIFKYPVKLLTLIGNLLLKPFNEKTNFYQTRLSEDEIRIIISEGVKSGAIDETEQEIIENVFEFNDLRANAVMIPRTDMVAVDLEEEEKNIVDEIIRSGHTLVPVYRESPDNIIGVIHSKDLIKSFVDGNEVNIPGLIRPAYFVPETKLISTLLKEMQQRGERLAIVTDEYGGTEGVITMEDILEEIVGEFGDKSESHLVEYSRLPDGKYYVLGSMDIDDFNEHFNYKLPESEEYNTVAGFVADLSGKILNLGEAIKYEKLNIELIKKLRQKMVQFRIHSDDNDFREIENENSE